MKVFKAHSITMPSSIAKAALILAITVAFMEIGTHAERRIDDEPTYFGDQDIFRAFNISRLFWLHTQNFRRHMTGGRSCTYFEIQHIDQNGMNYTSYYKVNGTTGQMPYHGKFYKTPPVGNVVRNMSNALNVSETSEKWHPRDYKLVYSNYNSCLILRVVDFILMNDPAFFNGRTFWDIDKVDGDFCALVYHK
ncbi:uncharacterized protein LOC144134872 [Amblyomma americanum]